MLFLSRNYQNKIYALPWTKLTKDNFFLDNLIFLGPCSLPPGEGGAGGWCTYFGHYIRVHWLGVTNQNYRRKHSGKNCEETSSIQSKLAAHISLTRLFTSQCAFLCCMESALSQTTGVFLFLFGSSATLKINPMVCTNK